MGTQETLHAQAAIPVRAPVAPSPINLTLQRADATLHSYRIVGTQIEPLGVAQSPVRDFCVSGSSLYVLTAGGEVLRKPLRAEQAPLQPLAIDAAAISANRERLLVLTRANELLLLDEAGGIERRCRFEHPARCINLGQEGTIWIAGGEPVLGGYQVFWSEDCATFRQIPWPASAVFLHGDRSGIVWTINSRGEVWKLHRLGEGNMPGCRQNAGCRNCRFNNYAQAVQIAAAEELFFVLHESGILRGYPFAGATEPSLEWQDVARFSAT